MHALYSPAHQVLSRVVSLNASVWILNLLSLQCTRMYNWNSCQNDRNKLHHSFLTNIFRITGFLIKFLPLIYNYLE